MFCQECKSKFPYFHTGIEYYIIIFKHGYFLIFSSKFNVSTTYISFSFNKCYDGAIQKARDQQKQKGFPIGPRADLTLNQANQYINKFPNSDKKTGQFYYIHPEFKNN